MSTLAQRNRIADLFIGAVVGVALTVGGTAWWMQDCAIVRAYTEAASPWTHSVKRADCIVITNTMETLTFFDTNWKRHDGTIIPHWSCVGSRGWMANAHRADAHALQAP